MRKNVFMFGLVFVFLFIVVSGSFAEVCLQKSFLIGEFEFPLGKYFTLTPNIIHIIYDENDMGVKS